MKQTINYDLLKIRAPRHSNRIPAETKAQIVKERLLGRAMSRIACANQVSLNTVRRTIRAAAHHPTPRQSNGK